MTTSSVFILFMRLGISLYFPIPILHGVRKEGDEKEEQKCGKSLLGNSLIYKIRKIMMI